MHLLIRLSEKWCNSLRIFWETKRKGLNFICTYVCHIYLYIDTNINLDLYIQPEPGNWEQIIKKQKKGIQLKKDKYIFKKCLQIFNLEKQKRLFSKTTLSFKDGFSVTSELTVSTDQVGKLFLHSWCSQSSGWSLSRWYLRCINSSEDSNLES